MSAIGVPIVSKRTKRYAPLPKLNPWEQKDTEKATCLVTLAAQDGAAAPGIFVKVGSELAVLVNDLVVGSQSAATFASAEFYVTGAADPQHHVKLKPRNLFERCGDSGMVLIGLPKSGRPQFEDEARRGLLKDLPPMQLCTDPAQYPGIGDAVSLISHPFGGSKIRVTLYVADLSMKHGVLRLDGSAPDGCHGSPLIYNGKCVAILQQPKIGPKATAAKLMHTVLPKAYWATGVDGGGRPEARIVDYELRQIQDAQKQQETESLMGEDSSFLTMDSSFTKPQGLVQFTDSVSLSVVTKEQAFMLNEAVRQGNLEAILRFQRALGRSCVQSWRDFNGRSLVHFAVFYSNPLSLAGLKREGFDVFSKTLQGDSCVHIACYQGSLECLRLLHRWGVPLHEGNAAGDTPAHKAALRGGIPALAFLRGKGVDVVGGVNGQGLTPLDVARESGTKECVEMLESCAREDERAGGALFAGGYGGMHVPGFYLTKEDWQSNFTKPGDMANRNLRTRETERGTQNRGADDGLQKLYLTAKSKEASQRAERKVERAHQHWFAEEWFSS